MEKESREFLQSEVEHLRQQLQEREGELERLKETEQLFKSLFDTVNEEAIILDSHYTIRDMNRAFLDRLGLTREQVVGRKCYEVRDHVTGPCVQGGETCPLETAKDTMQPQKMIHHYRSLGGRETKYRVILWPIGKGGTEGCRFLEVAQEVTDHRRLIRELQSSEQRMHAILNTATNAILSVDEKQRIILFNDAAQEIFGYTREDILGKGLNLLIPSRYGEHQDFVKRFLETKRSKFLGRTHALTALRRDGQEFPVELSLSHMEIQGKVTFTAIIRDVSETRHLEKKLLQSERLAAVGQAVAHVAHEIKNPLMIIGGFSNQIKKILTNPRDYNKLEMILEEVGRLERLVAGLGDFTKTYQLVKRTTDINAVLRDVMKIMAEVYPPESFRFKDLLSRDLNEISCDPDKLKQVFINVISNGFEAMSGGGLITILTRNRDNGIEIRIKDEGVGIPEEDIQHIFEPFYTTRERGSGLGLPISYKIVEAHGGDIFALRNPEKGTTMVVQLPIR